MEERNNDQRLTNRSLLHRRLDAAGWGLFFIWVGIALVAHAGWGAGLLGVGIITLGMQVVRKYFALRVEVFWVMVGFFFLVGGVWKSLNVQFGLIPILCIAAGLTLLGSTFAGRAGHRILK